MREQVKNSLDIGTTVAKAFGYGCLIAAVSPYLFYALVRDGIDNHDLSTMRGRLGRSLDYLEGVVGLDD